MEIDVEIIKPLRPIMLNQHGRVVILAHYLAKRLGEIKPGADIAEWAWHDIHNLPPDCAPNVYEIINELLRNY